MSKNKDLLTVKEAAEYLGVCDRTIYKLVNEKKIFAYKVGKKILIPQNKIFDFLHED